MQINKYEVYLVDTTRLIFKRIDDTDFFEVDYKLKNVLVKEEDLKKLEIGRELEIAIFFGFEWTRTGNIEVTGTMLCSYPYPSISFITTF
jgi:hypothetical protein